MKKLILCLSVAFFASWAGAQTVLFDSSVFTNTVDFPSNNSYGGSDKIFADDVTLASPANITSMDVEFVNSGIFGTVNTTADIVFALWSDDGFGDPDTTALWTSGINSLSFAPGITSDPSSFATTVNVPVPNVAVDAKVFWSVEVHNLVLDNAAFGPAFGLRRNTELNALTNPVDPAGATTGYSDIWADQSQTLGGTPTWVQGSDAPMSVKIFGVAVPEPSMAGLFLIGLACLGMIRKLKTM